jgi:uncharacterized protein YlaN (UPF0358 family)
MPEGMLRLLCPICLAVVSPDQIFHNGNTYVEVMKEDAHKILRPVKVMIETTVTIGFYCPNCKSLLDHFNTKYPD